jgi:hypothetical protein
LRLAAGVRSGGADSRYPARRLRQTTGDPADTVEIQLQPLSPDGDNPAVGGDRAFKIATVIVLAFLYFLFIDRFSVDLNGQRYFTLHDDQMISMRYADNLAAGRGLVWKSGWRVSRIRCGRRTWRSGMPSAFRGRRSRWRSCSPAR